MMPEGAPTLTRSVDIWHNNYRIEGFQFFDKEKKIIFKIGHTYPWKVTVELAEDEVIMGVVAKCYHKYQSVYTDFQFQIAKLILTRRKRRILCQITLELKPTSAKAI